MGYLIKSEVLDAIHEDFCTSLACYDDFKTKSIVEFCYQSMEREIDNLKQYRLDTVEEQETVNRWIPCSEKLPEENQELMLTFENSAGFHVGEATFKGNYFWYVTDTEFGYYEEIYKKPIAWQPKLAPYRPD